MMFTVVYSKLPNTMFTVVYSKLPNTMVLTTGNENVGKTIVFSLKSI